MNRGGDDVLRNVLCSSLKMRRMAQATTFVSVTSWSLPRSSDPEAHEDKLFAWPSSSSSEDALCGTSSMAAGCPGRSTSPTTTKKVRTRVAVVPPMGPAVR